MNSKTLASALLALAGTASLATPARAVVIFDETFETYTLGNSNGQGGWVDFGGTLPVNVVNTLANGGTQSLAFPTDTPPDQYGADTTLDLAAPITSGLLVLSFDLFQPAAYDGNSNFFLSRGPTLTGTFDEGLHLIGDGIAGTFSDTGSPTTPLITDQWVQVLVTIDLDANTAIANYGGTEIFNGAWNNGGASPTQYQGLNIWSNGNGTALESFNIDNLRLEVVPEPGGVALLGLGVLGLAFRRRRS